MKAVEVERQKLLPFLEHGKAQNIKLASDANKQRIFMKR